MHNLKPNREYRLITLTVAVPTALEQSDGDFISCSADDAKNGLYDLIAAGCGGDGVVADWTIERGPFEIRRTCLHPEQGDLFEEMKPVETELTAPHWIDVKGRLPDGDSIVLLQYNEGYALGFYDWDRNIWFICERAASGDAANKAKDGSVTAWYKFPEAPERDLNVQLFPVLERSRLARYIRRVDAEVLGEKFSFTGTSLEKLINRMSEIQVDDLMDGEMVSVTFTKAQWREICL